MDYVRVANLEASSGQNLASRVTGSEKCRIGLSRVAPGAGSPSGLHIHEVDQLCYVLKGTLKMEIGTDPYEPGVEIKTEFVSAGPNTLLVVPAGIPHRNWNDGPEAEYHLDILVPEPEPGRPGSTTVRDQSARGP